MTTHQIIYAWGDSPDSVTGQWSANTFYDESAAPYVSMAVLAMAYEIAAARVQQHAEEYAEFSTTSDEACQQLGQAAQAVSFLTPQDAIAALKRERKKARNEALEEAATAAYEFRDGRGLQGTGCIPDQIAATIRAMKEPES